MDREQFWALIQAARAATGGDCRAQAARLVAALGQHPVGEVLDYDRIEGQLMAESYRWDLWGAACLIGGGGCSDDGFDDFRGWLLGQGRANWQAALADPDSLAAHPQVRVRRPDQELADPLWCDDMLYLAYDSYRALTGQELTVEVAGMHPRPPELRQDWDFDNAAEMRHRCRVCKRDGMAGLVGWMDQSPPKAAACSRRVWPHASIALAGR
jgi:Protein of unknown function (DUF4240)